MNNKNYASAVHFKNFGTVFPFSIEFFCSLHLQIRMDNQRFFLNIFKRRFLELKMLLSYHRVLFELKQ